MTIYLKKEKRTASKKGLRVLSIICLLFTGIITYGVYWAFSDIDRLPRGEYLAKHTSPGGHYTLKAYLANGGATTSYVIRGELVFNESNKKAKNIYWNETANITWRDNDTVEINGHTLDVLDDKFDFRLQ